jgi:hypothetical protein
VVPVDLVQRGGSKQCRDASYHCLREAPAVVEVLRRACPGPTTRLLDSPGGVQVYGEDIAILSGDALLSFAFEHIARSTQGVPAERVLRVSAAHGRHTAGGSSRPA